MMIVGANHHGHHSHSANGHRYTNHGHGNSDHHHIQERVTSSTAPGITSRTQNRKPAPSVPASDRMHKYPRRIVIDNNKASSKLFRSEEAVTSSPFTVTDKESASATDLTTSTTSELDSSEEEQGPKCCCCDYRQAVIIVNIFIVLVEALILVLVAMGLLGAYLYDGEEDLLIRYKTTEIEFSIVSILLSSVAIAGAYLYNIYVVGINMVWLLLSYILRLALGAEYCNDYCGAYYGDYFCFCGLDFPAVLASSVMTCLLIYPHVGFLVQIRKDVQSKETCPREQYSCCCV